MTQRQGYAPAIKILHWAIALAVAAMLASGFYMASIGFSPDLPQETQDLRNALYTFHKSTGLVVLALMILRVVARLAFGAPPLPDSVPRMQRAAAGGAQLALYALLFAAPILGWAATSAGGFMEPVYGLFSAPALLDRDPELARELFPLHRAVALGIIAVLAAHVGGAFFHLLIRRDGVFRRMWF